MSIFADSDTEFAPLPPDSLARQHARPRPITRSNVIASAALAIVISVSLAACFFIGLAGGFRP